MCSGCFGGEATLSLEISGVSSSGLVEASTPKYFFSPLNTKTSRSCLDHDNRPLPTCHRIIQCSIISSQDIFWSWSSPIPPFTFFYPAITVSFSFVELLSIALEAVDHLPKTSCISATFMAMDRVKFLYLNDPTNRRPPPGFGSPQQTSASFAIPNSYYTNRTPSYPLTSPTISTGSTFSTSPSSNSESLSWGSSQCSASTAPSLNRTPPWHANNLNYAYDLPCEFAILGCEIQFPPGQFESWISHTLSHFGVGAGGDKLPPKAICTFCDDRDGVFENYRDPLANWRQRMLHIGAHYAGGMQYEQLRPDYFVIDYMWQNALLSCEDYELARKYTERKHCDGLVAVGHKTKEMRRKEERSLEDRHNLDQEKRQMKREKVSGKEKEKGKDTRQSSQIFRNPVQPYVQQWE
jgi:hypothetical protein